MFAKRVSPPYLYRVLLKDHTLTLARENKVYLTFDDGPTPELTPWLLQQLRTRNAKATFFLNGSAASEFPELVSAIQVDGHNIGNHGFQHPDAWKISLSDYLDDVQQAQKIISSDLFRPPYGRLTPAACKALSPHFKIVLWNLLSYDYQENFSAEECLRLIRKNLRAGSVIVFHDQEKLASKLKEILPVVLDDINNRGWECCAIKA